MARSTWDIYVQQSGGSWPGSPTATMYTPNEDLELTTVSTEQTVTLANGGQGFAMPETKSLEEPLKIIIHRDDGTIGSTIRSYIQAGDYIKLIDQDANTYIGKFTKITRIWLTGVDGDEFDYEITFQIQE